MTEPVKFSCPRCGQEAMYYGSRIAGCLSCGRLLYSEIPKDIARPMTWVQRVANGQEVEQRLSAAIRKAFRL